MRFLFNLLLALIWCALMGSFSTWNLLAGIVVGAGVLTVYAKARGDKPYLRAAWRRVKFTIYFARLLVSSNVKVAWEVLTPRMHQQPRIIRYDVSGLTEVQRAALASAITLTPGTLVADISPNQRYLYVHCMYAKDRDAAVREIDELWSNMKAMVFS
ncbi:MAG: Na+/H+ antiporter subunit E [Planctomycetota bacterium]|nr:Na+/H+ antiporter subunit E [Planctomycetota bacterium]